MPGEGENNAGGGGGYNPLANPSSFESRPAVRAADAAAVNDAAARVGQREVDECELREFVNIPVSSIPEVEGENIEYVEPVYPIEPSQPDFLVPRDEIRYSLASISRIKTLINQGIFFDVAESMDVMRSSSTSVLGLPSTQAVFEGIEEVNVNGGVIGRYGNLFPFAANLARNPSFLRKFYLYPVMSNLANYESQDEASRRKVDTLRYVMRKAWMRHKNGAATFQKSTNLKVLECPFDYSVVASDSSAVTGESMASIRLYPRKFFFYRCRPDAGAIIHNQDWPPGEVGEYVFDNRGIVNTAESFAGSSARWNPYKISRLSAYVAGPFHPNWEDWDAKVKTVFSKPLVPLNVPLQDVVHEIKMPFHEKEHPHLPTDTRVLEVRVRVGSNYISDKYREFDGPETDMTDAYNSYRRRRKSQEVIHSDAVHIQESAKFTTANIEEFESVHASEKNSFPMYVNINFATHQGNGNSRVCRLIKSHFMDHKVLSMLSRSFRYSELEDTMRDQNYARSGVEDTYAEVLDESIRRPRRRRRSSAVRENDRTFQGQLKSTVDFIPWLSAIESDNFITGDTAYDYPLGLEDTPFTTLNDEDAAFLYMLQASSLKNSVKRLSHSRVRNYQSILEGAKAYSETIGYKIEKFLVSPAGRELIQTFYMLDSDDIDRVNFIDTQVKYRREYVYRIKAINFVVGSEYKYTSIRSSVRSEDSFDPRNVMPTHATITSYYDYVDVDHPGARGPYRPVLTRNNGTENFYADVFPRVNVPDNLVPSIGKKQIAHTFANERFALFRAQLISGGYEFSAPLAPGGDFADPDVTPRGIPIWTVPVSMSTLTRRQLPTMDEITREWENRQALAAAAAAPMIYPQLTADLDALQFDRGDLQDWLDESGANVVPGVGEVNSALRLPLRVDVEVKPKVVLIEVPFFEKTVVMEDAPPVFPQVHFVPLKGVTDVVRINLSANTGEYMMEPVSLSTSDEEMFERVRIAQSAENAEKIKFKSDDPPAYFEIYRMTNPPSSITDFSDYMISTVSTIGSAATYDDSIAPNTKYYYMFRSADKSGKMSNPTNIYCCQLISTENGMYLDVSVYSEDDMAAQKVEKANFRERLTIRPAIVQTMFNTGDHNRDLSGEEHLRNPPEGEPDIGLFQKEIWGKTYKIRVRSKSSGKTYDINLKFKKKVLDLTGVAIDAQPPPENPFNTPSGDGSEMSATPPGGPSGGVDIDADDLDRSKRNRFRP